MLRHRVLTPECAATPHPEQGRAFGWVAKPQRSTGLVARCSLGCPPSGRPGGSATYTSPVAPPVRRLLRCGALRVPRAKRKGLRTRVARGPKAHGLQTLPAEFGNGVSPEITGSIPVSAKSLSLMKPVVWSTVALRPRALLLGIALQHPSPPTSPVRLPMGRALLHPAVKKIHSTSA